MEVFDRRDLKIDSGDIAVIEGKKYLVTFDRGGIAWCFVNLEDMSFDIDNCAETTPSVGDKIEGLGIISGLIKQKDICIVIED